MKYVDIGKEEMQCKYVVVEQWVNGRDTKEKGNI